MIFFAIFPPKKQNNDNIYKIILDSLSKSSVFLAIFPPYSISFSMNRGEYYFINARHSDNVAVKANISKLPVLKKKCFIEFC